jgi:hypothetical protein
VGAGQPHHHKIMRMADVAVQPGAYNPLSESDACLATRIRTVREIKMACGKTGLHVSLQNPTLVVSMCGTEGRLAFSGQHLLLILCYSLLGDSLNERHGSHLQIVLLLQDARQAY